ncbi:MAG TPA: DNA polymerase III subunit delta' [Stellaceae bacterium]|nr:DNA polymerase III subunit delta' [Stellaceae bacterium]
MSDLDDNDPRDGEEEGGAEPLEIPSPRANPLLLGHAAAEEALLQAHASGRLPHAWLLSGPRGVGKATLAFRFARFLFSEGERGGLFAPASATLAMETNHPIFRRVASGGMADLLVVERGIDPRRKRMRSEIVVEDTRAIAGFMRLTPAEGRWRVVILDGADLMNRNAANALLKILEEPPRHSVLLLTSDNPRRLLPTIRSRCRSLVLKPLSDAVVGDALARFRPDLSASDRALLTTLADGSIGHALDLGGGGLTVYRNLVVLLERLPDVDGAALHAFADRLARSDGEDSFRVMGELLGNWLARMVAVGAGREEASNPSTPGEAIAMRRLAARRGLDQWVEVWEKIARLFAQADSLNLDRKQVVLNAFFALEEAAR